MKKTIIILILFIFSGYTFAYEKMEDVAIHGFISQGYLGTTENNYFFSDTKGGTFQFNEMGLNFGIEVSDNLHLGIQFFAKDLGITGNDEVTINYAMADYSFQDWLGLRVGKIKSPIALYSATRDIDAGRLTIFLPQSIYNENYRDQMLSAKGVSLYGRLFSQIDYALSYGALDMDADSGISRQINNLLNTTVVDCDIDPVPSINILWNTPLSGLTLGGSALIYKFILNTESGTIELSGHQFNGAVEFLYDKFKFSSEYMRNPIDTLVNNVPFLNEIEAYYAMIGYQLTRWFETGGGYSVTYNDINNRDDPRQYMKDLFLSLRFDINDYWIFKMEGHYMDGLLLTNIDADASEEWFMYAAKLTFSF